MTVFQLSKPDGNEVWGVNLGENWLREALDGCVLSATLLKPVLPQAS